MDQFKAIQYWNDLCWLIKGVDLEGQEIQTRSSFGWFVSGNGCDAYLNFSEEDQSDKKQAAKFLMEWAKALYDVNFDEIGEQNG